jgi:hypothetical protein
MKFVEDIVDMVFDGRNLNVQMNRDLFVRQTLVDQTDDFRFTFCETSSITDLPAFNLASKSRNPIEG